MPITKIGYQVICSRSISKIEKELIIIIPINEKEEKFLDSGFLKVVRGNQKFTITSDNIICYGDINLHTNSDDFCTIEDMKWLEHLTCRGIVVPSDYNYDEHCCYSPCERARYYDTTNPAIVTQYKHAMLDKPKRCCIFKERIYL